MLAAKHLQETLETLLAKTKNIFPAHTRKIQLKHTSFN
jgi:hypothetical protein